MVRCREPKIPNPDAWRGPAHRVASLDGDHFGQRSLQCYPPFAAFRRARRCFCAANPRVRRPILWDRTAAPGSSVVNSGRRWETPPLPTATAKSADPQRSGGGHERLVTGRGGRRPLPLRQINRPPPFSQPLASAGHDRARPFPHSPALSATQHGDHLLKTTSQRPLCGGVSPHPSMHTTVARTCAAPSAPTKSP
jgi:hypothetical protein